MGVLNFDRADTVSAEFPLIDRTCRYILDSVHNLDLERAFKFELAPIEDSKRDICSPAGCSAQRHLRQRTTRLIQAQGNGLLPVPVDCKDVKSAGEWLGGDKQRILAKLMNSLERVDCEMR